MNTHLGAQWRRLGRGLVLMLTLAVLAGCATGPNPRDPFESYNRRMTGFNDDVDAMLLKPAATAYKEVTPAVVRTGISNFFGNLEDVWSFANSVLQLRPQAAVESALRFGVNTVFGLYGLLDIASEMGIEKHKEDFGQTLGRWGCRPGLMWCCPFWGRPQCAIPWPWLWTPRAVWRRVWSMCPHATACRPCACWRPAPVCCAPAVCSMKLRWINTVSHGMCTFSGGAARFRMGRVMRGGRSNPPSPDPVLGCSPCQGHRTASGPR